MHISNVIGVAENFDAEGFHNIIVNILQMFLVDAPVLSSHSFTQLEPYLPLKVNTLIHIQVGMSVIPRCVRLGPSPEIIRG